MKSTNSPSTSAWTRRAFLRSAAAAGGVGLPAAHAAPAPFAPTWDSLVEHYRTPEWFRDAKFGIWAHWGAQCQPEMGDWYGRRMYIQGNWQYEHHVKLSLPADRKADVKDLWSQKVTKNVSGSYAGKVAAHGVIMVRVTPVR